MTSKISACATCTILTVVACMASSVVQGRTTLVLPAASFSQSILVASTPASKNNETASGTSGVSKQTTSPVIDKSSLATPTMPTGLADSSLSNQEQLDTNTVPMDVTLSHNTSSTSTNAPTSMMSSTDGVITATDNTSLADNGNTSEPDIPILRGSTIAAVITGTPSSQVTDPANISQSPAAVTAPTITSFTSVIDMKTSSAQSLVTDNPAQPVTDSDTQGTSNKTQPDMVSTVLPSVSTDADNSSSPQQQPANVSQSTPSSPPNLTLSTAQDIVSVPSSSTETAKQTTESIKTVTDMPSGSSSAVTEISNETNVNASSTRDISSQGSTQQPSENGSSQSTVPQEGVLSESTVVREDTWSQSTVHPNDGPQNTGSDSDSGTFPTGRPTGEMSTEHIAIHDITGDGSSGLHNVSKQKVISNRTGLSTNGKIALGVCIPLALLVATAVGGIIIWKRQRPREGLSALFDGMKTHFQYSYQNASQVDNDETSFILK